MNVGDPVRIAPKVRRHAGKPGFVVSINPPEFGVLLTIHRPPWDPDHPNRLRYNDSQVRWFQPSELLPRGES